MRPSGRMMTRGYAQQQDALKVQMAGFPRPDQVEPGPQFRHQH